MRMLCFVALFLCFAVFDEKTQSPTELVRQAIEKKQKIATWLYTGTPRQTIAGLRVAATSRWNRPENVQAGDVFLLSNSSSMSAYFEVSQILNEKQFLDLEHGLLVEGFDTSELSDGEFVYKSREGQPLLMFVGVVVGPHQYDTVANGKKTVTHIRLALHPDFVLSDEDKKNGFRVWKSKDGQLVAAKFLSKRGSQIRLMTKNKKQITVKMSELSAEDVAFVSEE